ncbi:SMI1/KNR4 family protein [Metabacillus arenae]|uniref:SMI1/KNR4 family protein n=1 Tax=Metabacillus arenae TaxID=2771434 RepID=A0A926NH90_9BACI|nr:SMI1/KNR4 family protein [Metabacillus arenae]MBD1381549.1 SMI1/KNR4 family protein [Metabacillus arenae]
MNYSVVEDFIDNNKEELMVSGGVCEEKIQQIEIDLDVILPTSYKWFLRKYGEGGLYGVNILGYNLVDAGVVERTKDYRKYYALTEGIVVIEDIDEFSYCLDTNKMKNGECPVILWANQGGYGFQEADNFLEFFFHRLEKGKDDLDEDEDWDNEY